METHNIQIKVKEKKNRVFSNQLLVIININEIEI
jgi:hypothetical protein